MRITIAREPGRCPECGCRYRPGEVMVDGLGNMFHTDCFRTRGSYANRAWEDEQRAELDRLLAVIQAEDMLARGRV